MVIGRMKGRRTEKQDGGKEIARRVRELDELLDTCFLADVAPALERAQRARKVVPS